MKRASPNLAIAAALLALSLACPSSSKQAEAVGDVFVNGFTDGIVPQLFGGATPDSMAVDTSEHHSGTSSIRFDLRANGVWEPTASDNTEAYVDFDSSTTPALTQGGWLELDIPMGAFLANNAGWNRAHLAQLIFSAQPAAAATVFVDNVCFHK